MKSAIRARQGKGGQESGVWCSRIVLNFIKVCLRVFLYCYLQTALFPNVRYVACVSLSATGHCNSRDL